MVKPNYTAVSTVYGLFAPLMIVRFMSRQLTLVDLSLEPRIELQYFLAGRLYGSFKDDSRLAAIKPVVPYEPLGHDDWRRLRKENPSKYWWQGLTMGRLEGVLDLLTVPHEDSQRLASFGEFEQLWQESVDRGDERACKTLAIASNALLLRFRPDERPVFWRVLIAQARLYQALIRTKADASERRNRPRSGWLSWRSSIPSASTGRPKSHALPVLRRRWRLRTPISRRCLKSGAAKLDTGPTSASHHDDEASRTHEAAGQCGRDRGPVSEVHRCSQRAQIANPQAVSSANRRCQ
jgi:hypothetical protein